MIGVLIMTHGRLGEALLEAAAMLVSDTSQVRAIGVFPGQGVEDLERLAREAVASLSFGNGLLCLVDLPGGTPARVAGGLAMEYPKFEVVTGVNLPMLVEVLLARSSLPLKELCRHAVRTGGEGIADLGSLVRANSVSEQPRLRGKEGKREQ